MAFLPFKTRQNTIVKIPVFEVRMLTGSANKQMTTIDNSLRILNALFLTSLNTTTEVITASL